jgi:hypothetical protein
MRWNAGICEAGMTGTTWILGCRIKEEVLLPGTGKYPGSLD